MHGAREYEFTSLGPFVSCGDTDFLRRTLTSYGYRPDGLDEALQRRLLTYALLHRYSSLDWYLTRLPAPKKPTVDALATCWWALRWPTRRVESRPPDAKTRAQPIGHGSSLMGSETRFHRRTGRSPMRLDRL
jgi:hypothetical protein